MTEQKIVMGSTAYLVEERLAQMLIPDIVGEIEWMMGAAGLTKWFAPVSGISLAWCTSSSRAGCGSRADETFLPGDGERGLGILSERRRMIGG